MKQFLILLAMIFSASSAFAQGFSDISTGVLLSPFVTATKMLEITAVATLKGVASTKAVVQARGVAGKEQLKDELVGLNEAMLKGEVKSVADIEQPGLRELFEEIMADDEQMNEIDGAVQFGPALFKVATVVTLALILE